MGQMQPIIESTRVARLQGSEVNDLRRNRGDGTRLLAACLAGGAVLAVLLLAPGCDGEDGETPRTSCPSAPFRLGGVELPCDFDGSCFYQAPHSLGTADEGTCGALVCQCDQGKLGCHSQLVNCNAQPHACPIGIASGEPCERPGEQSNGECLFGTDAAGDTATHACACDVPGPIWRCVPL